MFHSTNTCEVLHFAMLLVLVHWLSVSFWLVLYQFQVYYSFFDWKGKSSICIQTVGTDTGESETASIGCLQTFIRLRLFTEWLTLERYYV